MPAVTINGPEISLTKKRQLSATITHALAKIYGLEKDTILIYINEYPTDGVAKGGKLIRDRKD